MQNSNKEMARAYTSSEEVIKHLNDIHKLLTADPAPKKPLQHLKEYIIIYAENNHNSEQVSKQLFKHEIISLIFGYKEHFKNPYIIPICLQSLQVFNLLLANCKTKKLLGRILLQPSLHEGLFTKALSVTDSQFIEYYVQLLKSITLKLYEKENQYLIYTFYNLNYRSFPLMLRCTFIATSQTDQLVKVTSRLCIMILVNLLKEQGMDSYLSQLPMLIFYAKLIQHEKENIRNCIDIDYIGELMWAIKESPTAFFALGNAICNLVIFDNLRNPTVVIKFVNCIVSTMRKCAQSVCPQRRLGQFAWVMRVQTTFFNILRRFLFQQFISSQFKVAYILSQLRNQKSVLFPYNLPANFMIDKFNQSCKNNFTQLQKDFNPNKEYKQWKPSTNLILYCEKIQKHYVNSPEFSKLKQSYEKGQKSPWFGSNSWLTAFGRAISNDFILGASLNRVSQAIGFKVQLNKYFQNSQMQKFIYSPETILFMSQFCTTYVKDKQTGTNSHIYKNLAQSKQLNAFYQNQIKGRWLIDAQFLNLIFNTIIEKQQMQDSIAQRYKKENLQKKWNKNKGLKSQILANDKQQDQIEGISGIWTLLDCVTAYLQDSIHMDIEKAKLSITSLILLERIYKLLNITVSVYCRESLAGRLLTLNSQIQLLFFQLDSSQVIKYMLSPQTYKQMDESLIFITSLIKYDVIQSILLKQKHKSFRQVYQSHMRARDFPEELVSFEVRYQGPQSCLMIVYMENGPQLSLDISLHGKDILKIDLLQNQIRVDSDNPNIVYCGGSPKPINIITHLESQKLIEVVERFRKTINETANKAIIDYLQTSMNENQNLNSKFKQRSKNQSSRNKKHTAYIGN